MWRVPVLILVCVRPCALAAQAAAAAAQQSLLSFGLRGAREADQRPIITGCLEECGTSDQSCVTQCQVCVEENVCPQLLVNCSSCLEEVQEMKKELEKLGNVGTDAGGASLAHEGVRQHLRLARLQAMEGTRKLRSARAGVLQAQRGVEWAAEETREEVNRLETAEKHLSETKKESKRWAERSKAKLEEMHERQVKLLRDVKRTMRQLQIANKALARAQDEVAQAQDLAHAGAKARKVIITVRVVTRLHWKLKKQREEVIKARKAHTEQKKDSSWFQRGLQKEVEEVEQLVKKQAKELDEVHKFEKTSREQLQEAKDEYRHVSQRSQNLTTTAAELQRELLRHPLPAKYVPPEVLALEREGG